ncbi:MAG TPA: SRPBCC family protein [Candidatus Binatia bacterium]|nr:SRPBCC family protein [Candidatus Binatia bacterium]
MKIYRLATELWVPRPRVAVFQFFADPANLERLTPGWLRFKIISEASPQPMTKGARLDYRLRIHGLPIKWQSEITAWNPPHRFVDRQTKGPYQFWEHEHTFLEREGGTLVCDSVGYSVLGGALVNKFLVAPDLHRIFRYRHRVLKTIFNSPG